MDWKPLEELAAIEARKCLQLAATPFTKGTPPVTRTPSTAPSAMVDEWLQRVGSHSSTVESPAMRQSGGEANLASHIAAINAANGGQRPQSLLTSMNETDSRLRAIEDRLTSEIPRLEERIRLVEHEKRVLHEQMEARESHWRHLFHTQEKQLDDAIRLSLQAVSKDSLQSQFDIVHQELTTLREHSAEVREKEANTHVTVDQMLRAILDLRLLGVPATSDSDNGTPIETAVEERFELLTSYARGGFPEHVRKLLGEAFQIGMNAFAQRQFQQVKDTVAVSSQSAIMELNSRQQEALAPLQEDIRLNKQTLTLQRSELDALTTTQQSLRTEIDEMRRQMLSLVDGHRRLQDEFQTRSSSDNSESITKHVLRELEDRLQQTENLYQSNVGEIATQAQNIISLTESLQGTRDFVEGNMKHLMNEYNEQTHRMERWRVMLDKLQEELRSTHYLQQSSALRDVTSQFAEQSDRISRLRETINEQRSELTVQFTNEFSSLKTQMSTELSSVRKQCDERVSAVQSSMSRYDIDISTRVSNAVAAEAGLFSQNQKMQEQHLNSLQSQMDHVNQRLQDTRDEVGRRVSESEAQLSSRVEERVQRIDTAQREWQMLLEGRLQELNRRVDAAPHIARLDAVDELVLKMRESLGESMERQTANGVRLQSVEEKINTEVTHLKQMVVNESDSRKKQLETIVSDSSQSIEAIKSTLLPRIENVVALTNKTFKEHEDLAAAHRLHVEEMYSTLSGHTETLASFRESLKNYKEEHAAHLQKVNQDVQATLSTSRDTLRQIGNRLDDLETTVTENKESIIVSLASQDKDLRSLVKEAAIQMNALVNVETRARDQALSDMTTTVQSVEKSIDDKFESIAQQEFMLSDLLSQQHADLERLAQTIEDIRQSNALDIISARDSLRQEITTLQRRLQETSSDLQYDTVQLRSRVAVLEHQTARFSNCSSTDGVSDPSNPQSSSLQ